MTTPQVAISQDFFSAFAGIPWAKQKKVSDFVTKFRRNPQAPGLNYEKINDAANSQYRSVRIDQDFRGIVLKPNEGNVFLLLWVDKHDDAYAWARRHKCEVNASTGSLQIYETCHETPVADPPSAEPHVSDAKEHSLFGLRDREFLRLGVPSDRLEMVRSVRSIEQFEGMKGSLPIEAFEALCFLAEGVPLDEVMAGYALPDGPARVDTDDLTTALQRPQTQRRFWVVGDELELQRMLDAPLEQWRVFLHPSQRRLVERAWNGPIRVLGGAGTGKTVVAMHRARWLAENVLGPDERLLFATFTRNLAMEIEGNLRKLCSEERMRQIDVTNIDSWVYWFLKSHGRQGRIVYPGQEAFDRCWRTAVRVTEGSLALPETFYLEEWQQVVLPQRITSLADYLQARRLGRGVPLSRKQRAQVWPVFEEMRSQVDAAGLMTPEDGVFQVLDMLQAGEVSTPYRAAIVDEAQDLGAEALKLIRGLVAEGPNDLMIVGDGHQRIYGRRAALSHSGINIRGRGRKLRVNYRTTEQIRRVANAVLEGLEIDDLDGGNDSITGCRSLVEGRKPTLLGFATKVEEAQWVADEAARLTKEGLPSQGICIIGRTAAQLKGIAAELEDRGLAPRWLGRGAADDAGVPGVRLGNMHRVKGLEFKAVFLTGIRAGVVPLPKAVGGTEDPVERRARELNERALLHVAASRAVQWLAITWWGEPSPLLEAE